MRNLFLIILALICLPFAGVGFYEMIQNKRDLAAHARTAGTVT
jgi:hypothetical protein